MSTAEWCIDCPDCYDRDAHRVNAPCGKVHDCAECAAGRGWRYVDEQGVPRWEHPRRSPEWECRAMSRCPAFDPNVHRKLATDMPVRTATRSETSSPQTTRMGVAMPDEGFVLARPWRGGAYIRIELPVIENACGYCGWEHPPRDHGEDTNCTDRSEEAR